MARKVGSGRRGTVDEEEYLLQSVTRLVTRFGTAQADTLRLLPHLLQLTEEHRTIGHSLREDMRAFELELDTTVAAIWQRGPDVQADPENALVGTDAWAGVTNKASARSDPLEKVGKPDIGSRNWGVLGGVLGQ